MFSPRLATGMNGSLSYNAAAHILSLGIDLRLDRNEPGSGSGINKRIETAAHVAYPPGACSAAWGRWRVTFCWRSTMRTLRRSLLAILPVVVLTCVAAAQTNGTVIEFTEFSNTTTEVVYSECVGGNITINVAFTGFTKVFVTPTTTVNTLIHELSLGNGVSDTGVIFQSTAASHDSTRIAGANQSYEDTFTTKMQGVTQGSTPNVLITARTHVTVIPDGTVTSSFESIDVECRAPQQ